MARIQILELPEGADDPRPPFVLIFDQVQDPEAFIAGLDAVQAKTGACAALVFEESIDIPAAEAERVPQIQYHLQPPHAQGYVTPGDLQANTARQH